MSKIVDYYLSLISPYAYLGSRRLEDIARRHGAEIRIKPVDYSVIFPRTGGLPLAKRAPERQAYRLIELARWSAWLELPLNPNPRHFPAAEKAAALLVLAAVQDGEQALKLGHAILRAVWAEERDIADPPTLKRIAEETGCAAERLIARAQEPAIEARYRDLTDEALASGVFGAPTYVYRDERFWGQDRLDFLDRALAG